MNSPLLKFFTISITNILIGGGSGVLIDLCMAAQENNLEYSETSALGMWVIGALFGLILGWIAYYGIYRRKATYETVCFVVTITILTTALSTYGLNKLIDGLGWFAIFIVPPVFIFAALFTWDRQRRSVSDKS